MFKKIVFFLALIFIFTATAYAEEDTLTISTYYPSPYGVYKTLRLYPNHTNAPASSCTRQGEMYFNDEDNKIYTCNKTGTETYAWQAASGSAAGSIYQQKGAGTFNWTVPSGISTVYVTCVGAGAGGGGGGGAWGLNGGAGGGGGGGGGGTTQFMYPIIVDGGTTYTVSVGAGGTGGTGGYQAGPVSTKGADGAGVYFGPYLVCNGGSGGGPGASATCAYACVGAGGTGGATGGSDGKAGYDPDYTSNGGNGGSGSGAIGGTAGAGGAGCPDASCGTYANNGKDASGYGAGGGGAGGCLTYAAGGNGGKGSDGYIILQW